MLFYEFLFIDRSGKRQRKRIILFSQFYTKVFFTAVTFTEPLICQLLLIHTSVNYIKVQADSDFNQLASLCHIISILECSSVITVR